MTKSELNNYVGIVLVLIVIGVEVFLFFRVKKNWSDLSQRGNNIFYIISMMFGLFAIVAASISLINKIS